MSECQQFPDTWEEFEQLYGFTDKEEVYTNGSRLMQSFRVKQWLDHIAEPERKWIPVTEALPEEGESVIVCSQYGAICIVKLVKGISEETRKKMKNGEIDDPCENLWCLSDGYTMSKRSDLYKEGDEFGNNQKDYAWRNGPYHYSGQEFIAWMPLPEPYKE